MAMMVQRCSTAAKRLAQTAAEQRVAAAAAAAFSSLSSMPSSQFGEPVMCGRGDKKTKRGKRFKGSYGNARPKKEKMIERIKDKVEVPRSTPWPLPFKLI